MTEHNNDNGLPRLPSQRNILPALLHRLSLLIGNSREMGSHNLRVRVITFAIATLIGSYMCACDGRILVSNNSSGASGGGNGSGSGSGGGSGGPVVIQPTLSLTASSTSCPYGVTITFSTKVSDGAVGTITFSDSGVSIGTATIVNNSAVFSTDSLTVGTHTITASLPASSGFSSATSNAIVLTVSAATPALDWPVPAAITYGTALTSAQLDATSGNVAGSFAYSPAAGTVLTAGTDTLTVTFTPTDSRDYTTAMQTVPFTVQKATPIITWPTPSSIYYGAALSVNQLDASASVPGTFTYSPALGTVLSVGTQTLNATFTPVDSIDYNSTPASVAEVVTYPPVAILVQSTSVLEGQSSTFVATEGGSVVQQVQWAVDGIPGGGAQVGTISSGGIYTAPTTSGISVTITATFPAPTTLQASVGMTVVGPTSAPGTIGFAFTLPSLARTSAGVYDPSGDLIKTLWSNQTYNAGPATAVWDGTNDADVTVPSGSYQIRVLYNNVQYSWGVIGNTSSSWTNSGQSWDPLAELPNDIAVIGDTAYVASGYAEGRPNVAYFALSTPNQPQALFNIGPGFMTMFMATDGKLLYIVNMGNDWSGSVAYVTAFNPITNQFYNFPDGTQCGSSCSGGGPSSVLDFIPSAVRTAPNPLNVGTGIAVQTAGNLLAVSHGSTVGQATNYFPSEDLIELFDKTSGALVGKINIPNPQRLAFEPDGNLWAISGNTLVMISSVGQSNTIGPSFPGVVDPLAITVDPSTGNLFVVDGGSSQQIKQFSESGQLLSTYGDAGGYTDCNPTVSNSRLFLDDTAGVGYTVGMGYPSLPFVTVLPDGSFWFSDQGNARTLHISAQGDYLEQIAYLRFLYHVNVDHGNPSRVFANDLEFNVDLTKALVPGDPDPALGGDGSWKLVENWAACMPTHYAPYFYQVQTMPNGITYAGTRDNDISNSFGELAELPVSGPVQFSGQNLGDAAGAQCVGYMNNDGSLGCWSYNSVAGVESQIAYRQDLTGYDPNNWPVWGDSYAIASVPVSNPNDPYGSNGWAQNLWPQATTGGILVTYNTEPATPGEDHHVGGVQIGGNDWIWKASPGEDILSPDGQGTFPDTYSGNDGITALAEGNSIFEGFAGNYFDFSSQWMQWSEDGLLIGQFGHACNPPPADGSLWPGCGGNIATMFTASANGNIYLYNSDENYHPGVHQWTISGLDSIHEISGTAQIGGTVTLQ
jgi:hypothetical protein